LRGARGPKAQTKEMCSAKRPTPTLVASGYGNYGPGKNGPGKNSPAKTVRVITVLGKNRPGKKESSLQSAYK